MIYSSIDRGFIEPANSAYLCKVLGLQNVRNFDIVDACMGWASAVQVANSFLTSAGPVNTILIINAEFPMDKKGLVLPNNFAIENKEELRWKFASYTLGEAASACIFQRDQSSNVRFEFIENTIDVDLCTILGESEEKYYVNANDARPHMQFYADSAELYKKGLIPAINVLKDLLSKLDYKPKCIFPHSVSNKVIQSAGIEAGIHPLICSSFQNLGNLATVSIPSCIKKALVNNLVTSNDKCVAWVASAGMKFSAFEVLF